MKARPADAAYESFLSAPTRKAWEKLGLVRRAGAAAPLFSLWSKESVGIGEIPDLIPFVDWCRRAGISIAQLLPLNDTGFDFQPYSAQSGSALDPMYLNPRKMEGVNIAGFRKEIEDLRDRFPVSAKPVDYRIKQAKLQLFEKMFQPVRVSDVPAFQRFRHRWRHWLRDFALYRVLKEVYREASWEMWPAALKKRAPMDLKRFERAHTRRVLFYEWLQWQLYLQMARAKRYANAQGVFIQGDIPFLVSRDSADVWARQEHYKLELSSGAPPDLYFANGQRWGMPPYNWAAIARDGYKDLTSKLKYAAHFYDMFRVDHVIGVFRLWTIPLSAPASSGGLSGAFDPPEEADWEAHGKKILQVMIESADMLPCGEDLGVVPACSYKTLSEWAIPGIDIQRWSRRWNEGGDFVPSEKYRKNGVSAVSTHDMVPLAAWWETEAGTLDALHFEKMCRDLNIDAESAKANLFDLENSAPGRLLWKREISSVDVLLQAIGRRGDQAWELANNYRNTFDEKVLFWRFLGLSGEPGVRATPEFAAAALRRAGEAPSIFSIQFMQDWLALEEDTLKAAARGRINLPGRVDPANWTWRMPLSIEALAAHPVTEKVREVNRASGRDA